MAWLERLAALPEPERRVRIPTITDPRGTDFAAAARLRQQERMVALERRTITAFEALGILMTDTCINYQTIMPPVRGEHVAYGDTGVVIYCNSVLGARSNFEGGPSALAAGLTGRTPRYGFHLDENRRATLAGARARHAARPADWGALGALVGRLAGGYWQVPLVRGLTRAPGSDALKHFGAAMASHGSVAMFHIDGVTPEARASRVAAALPAHDIARGRSRPHSSDTYAAHVDAIDVVVFSAPQLSLMEMQTLAGLLDGRRVGGAAARRHQPAGQAGRRPHGAHRKNRGGGRDGAVGDVLLPELRARDGGGEWLAEPCHQLGQAGQHHRRLRLPPGAAEHGALRRCRLPRADPPMSGAVFAAAAGMGQRVQGRALVARDGFSARYDLDRIRGVFARPEHRLAGQSYVGRILVLDAAKGGVATAWMLHEMAARGVVPAALVLNRANPIMVQGAAFAGLTMLSGFARRHHRRGAGRRAGGGGPRDRSALPARACRTLTGRGARSGRPSCAPERLVGLVLGLDRGHADVLEDVRVELRQRVRERQRRQPSRMVARIEDRSGPGCGPPGYWARPSA